MNEISWLIKHLQSANVNNNPLKDQNWYTICTKCYS